MKKSALALLLFAATTFAAEVCTNCTKLTPHEIKVTIGDPGTDDDVTVELCSEVDTNNCCSTPALKSFWTNDWSTNDVEVWDESYFGGCKGKALTVKDKMKLRLKKAAKTGPLKVNEIIVTMKDQGLTKTFNCGGYEIGGQKADNLENVCSEFTPASTTTSTTTKRPRRTTKKTPKPVTQRPTKRPHAG